VARGERKYVSRSEIERVARVYRTNIGACRALGISDKRFVELCQQYGIETPSERRRREWDEWLLRKRTDERGSLGPGGTTRGNGGSIGASLSGL